MKTKRNGHPKFYELLRQMSDMYSRKTSDYNEGNPLGSFLECRRAGIDPLDGLIVRLIDKHSRLCSLNRKRKKGINPEIKNESMRDQFFDGAVYNLIGIILLEESNAK